MTSNVALDVVIGLVFIYLLYSLLATVLAEIIATNIGLRARNLKFALNRMLTDQQQPKPDSPWYLKILSFIWESLGSLYNSFNLLRNPSNPIIDKFYNNPEIKYLGSSGIFKNPSSFKAESFSRTLMYELNGSGQLIKRNIELELTNLALPLSENINLPNKGVSDNKERTLDIQSAQFVLSLYYDSHGDLTKFKLLLEAWFDRTMEQALEWYKRKIQIILLIIGLLMATFFNADTFTIIKKLSVDKDARDKLVSMANAYIEKNQSIPSPSASAVSCTSNNKKLDSLLAIKDRLEADIKNANNILGLGGWLPDEVKVKHDTVTGIITYTPGLETKYLEPKKRPGIKGMIHFKFSEKTDYIWKLFWDHFWGFFITAIAISLGAPFWFDLLNKLMRLRSSIKQDTGGTENKNDVSPLKREA